MAVKKTTVYLPDDLKQRVERTAREQKRSEAEIIRAALDEYTSNQAARPRPTLPLFDSGRGNIAERVDELLAEGFGRD